VTTPSRQYPSATSAKEFASTIAESASGAADSAREAIGDAMKKGQTALSHARSAAGDAAAEVRSAADDVAQAASQQVTTFASELIAMTRRNPLGTLAAATLAGIVIGLVARGRGD
jgi:ElaB/YqjD/DUF883 family membrane-anchored ribosome-binding protein